MTNLSKYQLDENEIDVLKHGLDFSAPPRFLKKTDVFCQFDMIAKFVKQELEDNQICTWLKNKLSETYFISIWQNIALYMYNIV